MTSITRMGARERPLRQPDPGGRGEIHGVHALGAGTGGALKRTPPGGGLKEQPRRLERKCDALLKAAVVP